jgi:hypothetical protein
MRLKIRLLLFASSIFLVLGAVVGFWWAHVSAINHVIEVLKYKLEDSNINFKYDDIIYSKGSITNVEANINGVVFTTHQKGLKNKYNIRNIKIDSSLLNLGLVITIDKQIDMSSDSGMQKIIGHYEFDRDIKILITLKEIMIFSKADLYNILSVHMENIGFSYLLGADDAPANPISRTESIGFNINNNGDQKNLDLDLNIELLNHSISDGASNSKVKFIRDMYNIVSATGSNSMTLSAKITANDKFKIAHDKVDQVLLTHINNLNFFSDIYQISVEGDVENALVGGWPYFSLKVTIDKFEKLLTHISEAINIGVDQMKEVNNQFNIRRITAKDINSTANIFRRLSGVNGVDKVDIRLERNPNENTFLISGVKWEDLVREVKLACEANAVEHEKSSHTNKKNVKKKQ